MVSRKVVEKIAGQAALEVSSAGGRSGGFLGIGAEADLRARPKVDVDLTGATASVVVDVAIAYPNPIADSAQQVRDQMMARVGELAGVEVSRVDVNITALTRRDVAKEVLR